MRVRFPLPAHNVGWSSWLARESHNLKVEGSSPSPATKLKIKMGEEYTKQGKVMMASEAQTLRELVDLANEYKIPREDVVTIVPSKEGYVMVYYY